MWMATLVLPGLLLCAGCEDGTANAGEACVESSGVCTGSGVTCRESLPYPCPGQETCCIPLTKTPASPHDAGGE